jgi:hypothetical protein
MCDDNTDAHRNTASYSLAEAEQAVDSGGKGTIHNLNFYRKYFIYSLK